MIVVRDPRHLFIDESGDSERTLLLCALSLPESMVALAEASTDRLAGQMAALLPGFARESELKANRLARPLLPSEIDALGDAAPFRTHEREFVYRHALHHLADLPGAQVYAVLLALEGTGGARRATVSAITGTPSGMGARRPGACIEHRDRPSRPGASLQAGHRHDQRRRRGGLDCADVGLA